MALQVGLGSADEGMCAAGQRVDQWKRRSGEGLLRQHCHPETDVNLTREGVCATSHRNVRVPVALFTDRCKEIEIAAAGYQH